jgi:hypothetical protein
MSWCDQTEEFCLRLMRGCRQPYRGARMYFRKSYVIEGHVSRQGEVLQELLVGEADGRLEDRQ